jgi:hypothetical protein
MRGFGLKSLAVAIIGGFLFFAAGCKDDTKTVCCECVCENPDWITPLQTFYVDGDNLNCAKSCQTLCLKEHDFTNIQSANSVSCDLMSTDSGN